MSTNIVKQQITLFVSNNICMILTTGICLRCPRWVCQITLQLRSPYRLKTCLIGLKDIHSFSLGILQFQIKVQFLRTVFSLLIYFSFKKNSNTIINDLVWMLWKLLITMLQVGRSRYGYTRHGPLDWYLFVLPANGDVSN